MGASRGRLIPPLRGRTTACGGSMMQRPSDAGTLEGLIAKHSSAPSRTLHDLCARQRRTRNPANSFADPAGGALEPSMMNSRFCWFQAWRRAWHPARLHRAGQADRERRHRKFQRSPARPMPAREPVSQPTPRANRGRAGTPNATNGPRTAPRVSDAKRFCQPRNSGHALLIIGRRVKRPIRAWARPGPRPPPA